MNILSYEMFFELLYDTSRPNDIELPETVVTLEQERLYSSLFIVDQEYGTRYGGLPRTVFHPHLAI